MMRTSKGLISKGENIMYADMDRAGRMSIFEMEPAEVKIILEGLGHLIDAATSLRALGGAECEPVIRTAEIMYRRIRERML